jgi:hypothetical protein
MGSLDTKPEKLNSPIISVQPADASQFLHSPPRPYALKGHDSIARGNAPGIRREEIAKP